MTTVFPTLRYRDPAAAIEFLERALGFTRHAVHENDGAVEHAELRHGDGMIMLGGVRDNEYGAIAPPPGSGSTYIAVDDADALHERARAAGAEIVMEPFDTDHGSRDFSARDPEGNIWSFGTYRPS
jgi:uncharacterized glyoxalase superfamily protein PhnB